MRAFLIGASAASLSRGFDCQMETIVKISPLSFLPLSLINPFTGIGLQHGCQLPRNCPSFPVSCRHLPIGRYVLTHWVGEYVCCRRRGGVLVLACVSLHIRHNGCQNPHDLILISPASSTKSPSWGSSARSAAAEWMMPAAFLKKGLEIYWPPWYACTQSPCV